jgi:hypothetical protein
MTWTPWPAEDSRGRTTELIDAVDHWILYVKRRHWDEYRQGWRWSQRP